jgi:AAHS family 4-hydroxybenzoate transporter-like MFS transporter
MTQPAARTINIGDVLENSPIGPLHIRVFALCMISLIMDGFDVQVMGYVGPAIVGDWKIDRSQLGPVFAAANFGVLLGALLLSMLADKIGRRPVLVGATLAFSVLTIATAYAQTLEQLLWLRFIGGIPMGCIIPNATALVGEFSPKGRKVTLMMCITVGFTGGAMLAGAVALWLIPMFGWRSMFIFGGVIPLVVGLLMAWGLPESLQFLAVKKTRLDQLARWVRQLDPRLAIDSATRFIANEESRGGVPMVHLFHEGRGPTTILLWIVNFTNILILYSLSNWLPTIVTGMGYSLQTANLIATVMQAGGLIGTFGLAWVIARWGFLPTLALTFALATISIALIGQPGLTLTALGVIVFVAGWCIVGGQPAINALSATFYPTYLRSTGVGAGLGVGRTGAIIGPYLGGVLLAQQWTPQQLFWAAAVPALVSTAVILTMRVVMRMPAAASANAAPVAH